MDKAGLTTRQRRFVEEYVIDLNGKQAAIRAGYAPRTANIAASRLIAHDNVGAAIEAAKAERTRRTGVRADRVLAELARIGFSDVRKLFGKNGRLRAVSDLDDDTAAAIGSVEVVTKTIPIGQGEVDVEYTHKVKAWDKARALELLAKHLGILVERHELTGPGGGPIPVTGLRVEVVTANGKVHE